MSLSCFLEIMIKTKALDGYKSLQLKSKHPLLKHKTSFEFIFIYDVQLV